jgi:GNAT superfamily N-acetyltransferase
LKIVVSEWLKKSKKTNYYSLATLILIKFSIRKEGLFIFKEVRRKDRELNIAKAIEVRYNPPSAEEYISLRLKTGMGTKDLSKAEIALKNSLFIVSLWDKGKLIGFGRIVGDQGITYVVSDIMVDPGYQRKGIGKMIMKEIDFYLEKNTDQYAYVCLIANKPADKLYSQFGFEYVDPKSCGMKRKQSKVNKSL